MKVMVIILFLPGNKHKMKSFLTRPLKIKDKSIKTRLLLSPMSGLSHIAFREIIDQFGGCGLLFSEMSSAKAIPKENPKYSKVFKWRNEEKQNLVWQILGGEPESMARAAVRIEEEGFFGVDLNFSCSTSFICKRKQGAEILKTPDHAIKIVSAIRKEISLPIFVKFRTGWTDDPQPAVNLAMALETAGADALVFHPRVAPDRRTRPPKWDYIKLVKNSVSIPVFGNGNVFTKEDCKEILEQTGCDGVSLGRIAISRPWIFAQWVNGYEPDLETYEKTICILLELLAKYFEPNIAIKRFRKFSHYFCANFMFGHSLLSQIYKSKSLDQIKKVFEKYFLKDPKLCYKPNANLFI